jgi:hypothetical protein
MYAARVVCLILAMLSSCEISPVTVVPCSSVKATKGFGLTYLLIKY